MENSIIDEQLLGMKKEDMERVDLARCEVVRRQYLAHTRDNVLTIKPDGIQFNNTCIARMDGVEYIQMYVDKENRRLLISPCSMDDKNSQRWCNIKNGERKSRKLRGKPFCDKLYRNNSWSKGYSYKICGVPALSYDDDDRLIMVFDFDEAEKIPMTRQQRFSAGVEPEDLTDEERAELARIEDEMMTAKERGRRSTYQRLGVSYPKSWGDDSYGEKAAEHQNRPVVPRWEDLEPDSVMERRTKRVDLSDAIPVQVEDTSAFYNGSSYGQNMSAVSV